MERQFRTQARDGRQPLRNQRAIYVVFDDRHAVPACNVDERHATLETHCRDGRVLQVGDRENRLHRHAPAGTFYLVGQQAVTVARNADDFELEYRSQRFQAVVGELVGEDHAVCADQAVQHGIQTVLRTTRDHHVVGRRREAWRGHPAGAGGTRPGGTLRWLVLLQLRVTRIARQFRQRAREAVEEFARSRPVDGQVNRRVAGRLGRFDARHRSARHERPAPLAADHQSAQLQFLVRAGHRRHIDAQFGGQLPLRRQAAARRIDAAANLVLDRAGHLDIGGTLRLRRRPIGPTRCVFARSHKNRCLHTKRLCPRLCGILPILYQTSVLATPKNGASERLASSTPMFARTAP